MQQTHSSSKTPPLPPLFFLACFVVGVVLNLYAPLPFRPDNPWFKVVPLSLFLTAALLVFSALTIMTRSDTAIHPLDTPRALITTGAFRFTRNPIYLALLLALAATGAAFDSLWHLALLPILFLLLNTFVVPREERALTAVFGVQYTEYCHRVRRWL